MTKHQPFAARPAMADRRLLIPEPQRVMPVSLHPEILRRTITGRVRLIHRPDRRYARLQPGDMLWVREGLTIPARQPRGDALAVVYGGDGTHKEIHWPRAIARPSTGWLPAQAMPVHASRLTLVVTSVTEMRLQQITEDEAIAAGIELDAGGFGNPLVHSHHGQVFAQAPEAFGRMWDCALGPEAIGPHSWTVNPEVTAIGFRAIARNVVRLFPGLGSGGVR